MNCLYVLNNNVTYFGSFGVEHMVRKIKKFIDKSLIITNIFRIQAHNAAMCGYFCIEFIDFMLKGNLLICYSFNNNFFSPNNF